MFALPVDLNPLTAWTNKVFKTCVKIKVVAHLIEVSNLDFGAEFYVATIRRDLAQNKF